MSDQQPAPDHRPARTTARGIMVAGARVITGAVGLTVATAAVVAASALPLPEHRVQPPHVRVIPQPTDQVRACSGPLLRLGGELGEGASTASAVGPVQAHHGSTAGEATRTPLSAPDGAGEPAAFLTLPAGTLDETALLGGSITQAVAAEDMAGFAAAECAEAANDIWLVGGATDTGRTTLITLANPGTVAATVNLSIFSLDGEIEAPGTDGIIVQPATQQTISLAGLAPDVAAPVVRVQARGGEVHATLQQTTVRTLEPGGADIVSAGAGPATRTVIPGVVITGHEVVESIVANPGYSDLQAVVRFFVPGERSANVTITVSGRPTGDPVHADHASDEPRTVDFELLAGRVTELPLGHFEDGTYTLSVDSDVPIVAAARVATVGTDGRNDFAWVAAAPVLRDQALAAVAPGPGATLQLVNAEPAAATITVQGPEGPATVELPAASMTSVPVLGGADYLITGFDRIHAAVGYLGDGQVAGFPVTPASPTARPITVYP